MNTEREAKNPPFGNCQYKHCDLPGQCRGEGECHHPTKESTAALQKRIEELEAVISKKDEALEEAKQNVDIMQRTPCLCGTEHEAVCPYCDNSRIFREAVDNALALKAGDVQAPKDGFKVVSVEFLKRLHSALCVDNPFAEKETQELRALIAAAPADKEGK